VEEIAFNGYYEKMGQPKVLISTPLSMFGKSSLVSYVDESILLIILKTFGEEFSSLGMQ
jgi:hypothetical protein